MAEFPPNLDDGELWLPSDMFPEEVPPKFGAHHLSSDFSYINDIARKFAAFTLLQPPQTRPKFPLNSPPTLERLRPMSQYGRPGFSTTVPVNGVGDRGCAYDCQLGNCWAGRRSMNEYRFAKPAQPQVDSFLQTRTWPSQRHQNRFQNRASPFQRSGFGFGGGFVREYGGTGVFLPRVAPATTTSPNPTTAADLRKKQVMSNWHEMQVTLPRKPINNVVIGKQEECICQLPPEIALPQDWTY